MTTAKKHSLLRAPIALFFISAITANSNPAFAQSAPNDTTRNTLIASLDNTHAKKIIVKESNVVFPAILKGNEEETSAYIESFSTKRKDYLISMYKRGKTLLPKAAKILKKYNLPQELKVLLALESAYNPDAVSGAGAVGYWQFMDAAAKEYGLQIVPQPTAEEKKKAALEAASAGAATAKKETVKQNDDRKNFIKATDAAARYLRDRKRNLGENWLLVVASYNCGIGNVWNAMKKSGKENPTFWDIKQYLPGETRAYVMNFITMNVIFSNYDNFIKNKLVFKSEKVELPVDFEKLNNENTDVISESSAAWLK